ncbi:MAG: thiolase domain-containing protein [Thermoplasmata archaeon]|nr:MAG: thiolase domain-containing protein [Thermoplasmata archaeon]HDJ27424.1 thiolase domain-containing protein [Aciduliprofundum sp.]
MRRVAVIGVGETKYGEHWEKSIRELAVEAGLRALEDAGISSEDLDAIVGGNMSAGSYTGQDHIGALIADFSGIADRHIPAIRVEAACGSGGAAIHVGFNLVASGMYDIVLVGGVEKQTDVGVDMSKEILAGASDREWEAFFGATFPALVAMMAKRYMYEYGDIREQMAMIPVMMHENAMNNPDAHFHRRITVDDVLNSPPIAEPFHLLDVAPVSDGAAAIILAPLDYARKNYDTVVELAGSAVATDYIGMHDRPSLITLAANVHASRKAFRMAGMEVRDLDLLELHDAFSFLPIVTLEDLGLAERGKGASLVEEGILSMDGDLPLSPSGGLKAKGHPVGATGVGQAVEAVWQLRGQAGKRQVPDAEKALIQSIGGTGATIAINLFRREK